jgi:trehalose synthase
MGRIEARLQKIAIEPRPAGADEELLALAEPLRGARVLFVSPAPPEASDCAGADAALLGGLGIEAERAVLHGDAAFQALGRALADGLRGAPWEVGPERWRDFREACETAAVAWDARRHDVVVAQGAATAPLIEGRRGGDTAWVWRTGHDVSAPDPGAAEAIAPALASHASLGFGLERFALPEVTGNVHLIPPGIDPENPLVGDLAPGEAGSLLRRFGVRLDRPLVAQIGRLDAWSDPPAAIEAWRLARRSHPRLQLAIAGRLDPADPHATDVLAEARAFAAGEPGLHLITERDGAGAAELNALGSLARCTLRFGLGDELDPAVSASLWRGTPVLAAGAGAASQIEAGRDGLPVEGPEDCAERIAELAADPGRCAALGRAARRRARAAGGMRARLAVELGLLGELTGVAAGRPEAAGAAA